MNAAPFQRAPAPMLLGDRQGMQALALRPREAAKAIGISERTLWSMTQRGDVRCVRIGRAILYPVDLLREFLTAKAGTGAQP